MIPRISAVALVLSLLAGCAAFPSGTRTARNDRPAMVPVQTALLRSAAPDAEDGNAEELHEADSDPEISESEPRDSDRRSPGLDTRSDRVFDLLEREEPPPKEGWFRTTSREFVGEVWHDTTNFYDWETMGKFGLGLGTAAIAANTSIDGKFDSWFQNHVRSSATDGITHNIKWVGDGIYTVPIAASFYLLGKVAADLPYAPEMGQFGDRTLRGYAVGVIPMLAMQQVLGSARPGQSPEGSQWTPFVSSHGVSGDAFMGAMPFLAAAGMVENPFAKATLYAVSVLPAIGRIDYDMHYLSQAALGWFMAYLSMSAVNDTDFQRGQGQLVPIFQPNLYGLGAEWRW